MPNILFVDHAQSIGGAENSLLMLMRQLKHWHPQLATVEGKLATAARAAAIPVHIVPLPRLRRSAGAPSTLLRGALAIANVARQVDAAALHSNTVRATGYAAAAGQIGRLPFIWHMRDFWLSEMEPNNRGADAAIKQLLCSSARAIIANSHAVKRSLPSSAKVRVIHNGIESQHFQPLDQRTCRAQLTIPMGVPVVGMMGRLRPWKGQLPFLQMAAQVRRSVPSAHFMIVGGNPFSAEITDGYAHQVYAECRRLNLTESVTFTGQLTDVKPALAAMDVFVHPGSPEPFGLVNIEAMAMGKPVVAFGHGALPEIIEHAKQGLLVPPNDIAALAGAVVALLLAPAFAQKIGRCGRTVGNSQFDVSRTAQQVERLYAEILP